MEFVQSALTILHNEDGSVLLASLLGSILLVFCCFQWGRFQPPKLNYPVVGDITQSDFRSALEEGSRRYPNSPFILPTPMHPTVILPLSAINELKNLPEDEVSLRQHHYTIFVGAYTKFGEPADELDTAIRIDLTRNVEKNLQLFQDEIQYAFTQNVGDCQAWTFIPVYERMLRIISLLSSRVFVGLPLSRNEEWIKTTCQYAMDGGAGAHSLTPFPTLLRPLVAPFLLRSLSRHRALASRMMQPLLEKFSHAMTEEDESVSSIGGGDLIKYILSHYKEPVTADRLGRDQLIATFVAMHTTTICLSQVLFDLAARPEYVTPLREELEQVLREDDRHGDGRLHNTNIGKLSMMDSFIRESQRMNPPGLVTMLRHVMTPDGLHLQTGHVIPQGTVIGISNHTVTQSYPEGGTFDGFRFHKLRQEPGHSTRHQFVTTGPDALSFGHGSHACPGRFFAASEIKTVLVYLLQHFDITLEGSQGRPENHHRGAIVSPPPNGKILLQNRTCAQ